MIPKFVKLHLKSILHEPQPLQFYRSLCCGWHLRVVLNMGKYRSKGNKLHSFPKLKCWVWTGNYKQEIVLSLNCFCGGGEWRRNSLEQLERCGGVGDALGKSSGVWGWCSLEQYKSSEGTAPPPARRREKGKSSPNLRHFQDTGPLWSIQVHLEGERTTLQGLGKWDGIQHLAKSLEVMAQVWFRYNGLFDFMKGYFIIYNTCY